MRKIFTNDSFFAFVTWFAVIGTIPFAIVYFIYYNGEIDFIANVLRLMIASCLAVTYISYKKHAKNVMKGMIGAIMACLVMISVCSVFSPYCNSTISVVVIALTVLLFINHFVINSDHHSSPSSIMLNQLLAFIFALVSLIEGIFIIPSCINLLDTIAQYIICIAQPCSLFSIICIESRLDAYRKDREAAGWTEEKGYPENYVHEYQKNK